MQDPVREAFFWTSPTKSEAAAWRAFQSPPVLCESARTCFPASVLLLEASCLTGSVAVHCYDCTP